MSNHGGSYLINEVLEVFEDYKVFKSLGKAKTKKLLLEIRSIGMYYDCNDGEILNRIGERLGFCYNCWDYGKNFDDGLCEKCLR